MISPKMSCSMPKDSFILQLIKIVFCFQPIPLISTSRWLVKKGDLMCLHEEGRFSQFKNQLRQIFKGKFKPIYIFLFTDIVLVTKMKGDDKYKVRFERDFRVLWDSPKNCFWLQRSSSGPSYYYID